MTSRHPEHREGSPGVARYNTVPHLAFLVSLGTT